MNHIALTLGILLSGERKCSSTTDTEPNERNSKPTLPNLRLSPVNIKELSMECGRAAGQRCVEGRPRGEKTMANHNHRRGLPQLFGLSHNFFVGRQTRVKVKRHGFCELGEKKLSAS